MHRAPGAGLAELCVVETAQAVASDLQRIYRASTAEDALSQLDAFAEKWDATYPTISQMWRRNWEHLTPFFSYPADIRKVIYTTNAIESLNMSLRKVTKTRGSFPNAEAAMKLLFLALEHIAKKWTMPVQNWKAALQRFAILLGDRVPQNALA
jgi:putative transposase